MLKRRVIKDNLINKKRLIYLPLIIVVMAMLTLSVVGYYISKKTLLDQMSVSGINLAKLTARRINREIEALDIINKLVIDKIRIAGVVILDNKNGLSNGLLAEVAQEVGVDEINWYDAEGRIIFSSIQQQVGLKSSAGHPIKEFIKREKTEEVFDKEMQGNEEFKYGYFRSGNEGYLQIGIKTSEVVKFSNRAIFQRIVESLAKEESIEYALILDKSLKAIADSDLGDIGIDYGGDPDYLEALNGKATSFEWYYDRISSNVWEVAIPLVVGEETIGVLGIGLSMDKVRESIYSILISYTVITILMIMMVVYIQKRNILKPVDVLNSSINKIDIEKNIGYRLKLDTKDAFFGLASSINTILDRIDSYFYKVTSAEEKLKVQFQEIQRLANHDSLTGLPNRRVFVIKLEEEISNNTSGAVILLDLDNFKGVNDTLGHVYGDKVLRQITNELLQLIDEKVFISRFGGDEFLFLIKGADKDYVEAFAKKLLRIFKTRFEVEENELYISASVGITLYPSDSSIANQLIMNADMAMYRVKEQGKNDYMFFDDEMKERLNKRIESENILRRVVKERAFKLLYQPLISTNTGDIVGFEALLRLRNNTLSPNEFIPIAEETGMIIQIGRWITEAVLGQLSLWKDQGFDLKPVSINFSAKQLSDINYIEFLKIKLKEYDIEAKYIEIEITENLFLDCKERTIEFLSALKELGIKIAIDDFGTGYSSLGYLTFLPVDKIKLDKSLSDKYLETKNVKVIDGIISLAHSLNLEVVAEGIELLGQYKQLKVGGCNYIQGYFFSKPLEAEEVVKIYNHNYLHMVQNTKGSDKEK